MTDISAVVTVCQGPPRCPLMGDDAVAAAQAGCPWCDKLYIHDDGSEVWDRVSDDCRSKP